MRALNQAAEDEAGQDAQSRQSSGDQRQVGGGARAEAVHGPADPVADDDRDDADLVVGDRDDQRPQARAQDRSDQPSQDATEQVARLRRRLGSTGRSRTGSDVRAVHEGVGRQRPLRRRVGRSGQGSWCRVFGRLAHLLLSESVVPSVATSTATVSPSRTSPERIALASRSPISVWTSRRNGRAP